MLKIDNNQYACYMCSKFRKQKRVFVKTSLILLITFSFNGCAFEENKSYEYKETEVNYFNIDDNIKLSGTLTFPHSTQKVPAVLLLQGSGPHDRDEIIGRHKIFEVIAHNLANNGIAVLRTDKWGCGKSEGKWVFCDVINFSKDGIAGVNFLKNVSGIDSAKIGLIGHSLGGLIGSNMAIQSSDIQFIVGLATTGLWGGELI